MIDVERARAVLAGRVHRTPTFSSAALGVHLKAELFQKTGSFKARGALNRMAALTPDERRRGVVTWSAGNHAQAVAWAAAQYDVDCLVAMWVAANPLKVEATRGYGATVDLSSPDPAVAYERALAESDRVFVHPHDDPYVIAGHGTLALEILEDVPDVATVVVGVGGGGLVSGIVTALAGLGGQVRIVAVEPEQSQAFR
ncbi:MAG: pyridoxal-phosphate dependent enzyme, partial [Gaiellaceae bacterium]